MQNAQGKKKRVRINKERVDINAAANQQQGGKRSGKRILTTIITIVKMLLVERKGITVVRNH